MTDVPSGQSPEHWKRKYLDQLDQLEIREKQWQQLEGLLKRAIGRLSLAAEGHHKNLDKFIRDIRDSVRDTVNDARLETALEELSRRLAKIEENQTGPERKIVDLLLLLTESLVLPDPFKKQQQKLIKHLAKASDENSESLTSEWLKLFKSALETTSSVETKESEKKPGFLDRILGGSESRNIKENLTEHVAETGRMQSYQGELEIYRQCLLTFIDKMDSHDAPNGHLSAFRMLVRDAKQQAELEKLSSDLANLLGEVKRDETITKDSDPALIKTGFKEENFPSIQELLIRLLEQLVVPPDLSDAVDTMKARLEKETAPDDWQKLLKDVAVLINSIRSRMQQEKQEFEIFLHQITERLRDLDQFLQTESNSIVEAKKTGREFDEQISAGVQDIRNDMDRAVDLDGLKQNVQNRLDVISHHIFEYRKAEEVRFQDAQKNMHDMQKRMSTLEQETNNLKTVLVEKNRQALSDALTCIPNRLAYEKRIQEDIGRWKRFGTPLSIAVWDVDYFKKVNDTYGHKAGDKVLKTIAQLMAQRIRNTDFLARFGGEEFVMLLPGTKEEDTLRLVNELRKQVEECGFHYHGKAVKITVSCGVSSFRENDTLEQVFDRADKALYRAKNNGRNQCVIASVKTD